MCAFDGLDLQFIITVLFTHWRSVLQAVTRPTISLAINSHDFSGETKNNSLGAHTLIRSSFLISGWILCKLLWFSWDSATIHGTLHRPPLSKKTVMKTTYIFGAIKTDRGPFPVTGIVSQFTGIRTISWMNKVRNKTQFLSDSVLVIAATICPFQ